MTVVLLTLGTGCGSDAPPLPAPSPSVEAAPAEPPASRSIELVLERGRVSDGWVSVPAPDDRLLSPPAERLPADGTSGPRWRATLPPGPAVARVERAGCAPVEVPYTVGAVPLVVLPYPTCEVPDAPPVPGGAARLDRREHPWAALDALHGLDLFGTVPAAPPGQEDGPTRYVTFAEAGAICAWSGGRLPTRAEWTAARAGAAGTPVADATRDRLGSSAVGEVARGIAGVAPYATAAGHADLDGNVEEWLADGAVAGGSFVSLPEELGVTRTVPAEARSETVGFRCAYDGQN